MSAPRPIAPSASRSRAILVVDDHDLVRLGLRTLLLAHADSAREALEVIEARTLQAALATLRERGDSVAVVLLDLHLPDAHGLAGLEAMLAEFPTTRVVVLSGSTDPVLRRRALEIGAATYLSKSADLQHVASFLRSVGTFGDGAAAAPVTAPLAADAADPKEDLDFVDVRTAEGRCVQLTRRQSQVLERVLAGQSNRQIAEQTHLTEGTIKNHVSALLLMFGVRSRSQLISQLR
jgi:DNA-binding NarL/FixJ family response regulator